MKKFKKYLNRTWSRKAICVCRCPQRTNNIVESFNGKINKIIGTHPNIWAFLGEFEVTIHLDNKFMKKLILNRLTDLIGGIVFTESLNYQRVCCGLEPHRASSPKNVAKDRVIRFRQMKLMNYR